MRWLAGNHTDAPRISSSESKGDRWKGDLPMSEVHQLYAQKAPPTWSGLVARLNDPYLFHLFAVVLFCLFCLISLLLTAGRLS
jgi:hypothetical protein